jgi:hypothetical protein
MTAADSNLPSTSRASAPPTRLVAACTAVALSATLLAGEPARAHTRHASVSAAVAWSAAPAAAALESIAPAVACPVDCTGTLPPARTSRNVTEVTRAAARRMVLSRFGGRHGP